MDLKRKRIRTYWLVGLSLSACSILLSDSDWHGTPELHTLMEALSTIIALFVGLLALIRFYSRGGTDFLILGAGFIGVALLDGYHSVVSSIWFKSYLPSDLTSLIPWSWLASRLFLSIILLSLYFVLKWESENRALHKISAKLVYSIILVTTLCSFLFFAFVPLSSGYFKGELFFRPEELLPAIFFLLSLIGFIKLGDWRTNTFSHWLILAIIVNLVAQIVVMPYSAHLFDIQFDVAHLFKKLSYLFVLCGLGISVYRAFKDADTQTVIRKKAQISLEASEVRNRTIMNSLVDSLISINDKGIIENMNQASCQLFGYSKLEVLGKNIKMLMPEPYHSEHDTYLTSYHKTGEKKAIGKIRHVTGRKKDGSTFSMDLSISEMNIAGKPKYSAVIRDDTERQAKEDELILAKNSAQSAAEAKSNFLATMSHEIRTPMNGVLGMVEILQNTPLNSQQEDIITTISESGTALLEIINDILEYSKVEAGKIQLELMTFNLERTLYDVTRLLLVKAEEKGIELIFYFHTSCPSYVIGDAGRIRQIMLNLVGNAIKFTDTGQIVVEAKHQKQKNSDHNICIEVKDTGIGINNKSREMLFESFTQADNSTSRKYGGTGLGLAISKRLVDLMNGSINVESKIGDGSTFWIDLHLEEVASPEKLKKIDLKNVRALIVDDNPINLKILHEQLTYMNMRVDETLDPQQVIHIMEQAEKENNGFKLVIIDNMMPILDGANLGRKILNHQNLKHIPLVLLTSSTGPGNAATFKEIGFSAYLTKPIFSTLLSETLSRVLGLVKNNENSRFLTRHSVSEDKIESHQQSFGLDGNILLVEDILINQKVALGLLDGYNLEIDIANNGKEAIEKHAQNTYDLILMDCQMPIMDGFEATRKIRQTDNNTPIIAVTANALSTDREKCHDAGMSDYLAKPFNRLQLTNILSRWLNSSDTPTQNKTETTDMNDDVTHTNNEILNYNSLSAMKEAIGSVFDELIPAYLQQSDEMINSMLNLLENNDIETLERFAHSMKSSSLNVGAESVSTLSLTLEDMSRNNTDKEDLKQQIECVINEYKHAKSALLKYHEQGE
jgi:PAS domain S-box-containing protein